MPLANKVDPLLVPPYPYFGGKTRAAHLIWQALGAVGNYVEPFFGGGAALLFRPTKPHIETVGDLDGMIANFWRAVKYEPELVAQHADWPVNQVDLTARHHWLNGQRAELEPKLKRDPDYYDAKIAGWWVWGICTWYGQGWCNGRWHDKKPQLGSAGSGIHKRRGVEDRLAWLTAWFAAFKKRMREVRVCCGDWRATITDSVTVVNGITGILLDPPYSAESDRDENVYARDDLKIAHDVRAWAIANGNDRRKRIVLCGLDGEHDAVGPTWRKVRWHTEGGFAKRSRDPSSRGTINAHRETLWLSPGCLPVEGEVPISPR